MGEAADQVAGKERRTVLLVEDDALSACRPPTISETKGYHVIEAGTMIEAATVLSSGRSVHLVFSDVDLPGATGGLSLAVWIHAHHPTIPVILTSGVRAVMPTLADQRRIPFMPKPYDVDKLAALIAR